MLTVIGNAGLTLTPKKCQCASTRVIYLGYVIDRHGIRQNQKKTAAILECPRPNNVSKLRASIGMASYYRKFMKNFAHIVKPLTRLLKKNQDVKRIWGVEQDVAMETLKEKLHNPSILTHDDDVSQLQLRTDVRKVGLGVVLILTKNGESFPISF